MTLLARLRLAYRLLRAHRAGHWRKLATACEAAEGQARWADILAKEAAAEAIDQERAQLVEGIRTTHTAAQLLAEAQRLIQPKAKP